MAESFAATLRIVVDATLSNSLDLSGSSQPLRYTKSYGLTDGTGADKAKQMFTDQRTLAASATEDLDMSGTLTNAFGTTIAFTNIKALVVSASADNTNDVDVGGAASNGVISFFGDATDKLSVKPGGTIVLIAPDATGYDVTDSTADLLTITNSAGSTSVTYDIIVIGET
jgi:hypothetical protein